MVTADFDAYAAAQRAVEQTYAEPADWWRKAVLNTARMGWFSSDRTVRDYAREIWRCSCGAPWLTGELEPQQRAQRRARQLGARHRAKAGPDDLAPVDHRSGRPAGRQANTWAVIRRCSSKR